MRLSLTLLALIFVLMGACVITSVPQWRPAELTSVKCTKAQAEPIIKACREGAHNGDALQSFPQSDHVICQPQHSGQLCAMVLEFPDKRVFSYADGRSYSATVQARAWFNLVLNEQGNITVCRTRTE